MTMNKNGATTREHNSVAEMVRNLTDDESAAKEFESQLERRKLVHFLFALRSSAGLSQKEIAERMGCSQSRISKLENGEDDDLRLGDLRAYVKALGSDVTFLFAKRGLGLASQVKYHALKMRDGLSRLVQIAREDDALVKGIAGFHAEAFVNIAKMIQETASKLPVCPENGEPYIKIVGPDDCGLDELSDEENRLAAKRLDQEKDAIPV